MRFGKHMREGCLSALARPEQGDRWKSTQIRFDSPKRCPGGTLLTRETRRLHAEWLSFNMRERHPRPLAERLRFQSPG
jgi:hypothetical protein